MKNPFLLALLLPTAGLLHASNPCITTAYTADPSGHIFNDRLYVYCSHDRNDAREFDMTDYHVFSTDDLQNWSDHGVALDLAHIPWAESHLWAPDANFKDGTYYFIFPARPKPGENGHIGIATGTAPEGPFVAQPHPLPNMQGIDPSLYIDDDGTGYVVWAGGGCQIVKMKPNLLEPDGPYLKVHGCDQFFEGPWLFKRNGIYYMTYAAHMPHGSGHGGNGQYFDYAISKTVLGPYQYQGHFTGTRPDQGNIHGSQFEWKGKWYCLYHDFAISEGREKHGFKRSFMLDEMQFDADGKILPLKWTNEGPAQLKPLDAFAKHDATCLNQTPWPEDPLAVTIQPNPDGGMELAGLRNGAWTRYSGVDFGPGAARFSASVSGASGDGNKIELHLDALDGPLVGTCDVPSSAAGWTDVSCPVSNATGSHFLYLKFTGPGTGELFKLASFQFAK